MHLDPDLHPDERYIPQTDRRTPNIIQNLDALHNRPLRGKYCENTKPTRSGVHVVQRIADELRVELESERARTNETEEILKRTVRELKDKDQLTGRNKRQSQI